MVVAILAVLLIIGVLLYLIVYHFGQIKRIARYRRGAVGKDVVMDTTRQIYRHKTSPVYTMPQEKSAYPVAAYEPIVLRNKQKDFSEYRGDDLGNLYKYICQKFEFCNFEVQY